MGAGTAYSSSTTHTAAHIHPLHNTSGAPERFRSGQTSCSAAVAGLIARPVAAWCCAMATGLSPHSAAAGAACHGFCMPFSSCCPACRCCCSSNTSDSCSFIPAASPLPPPAAERSMRRGCSRLARSAELESPSAIVCDALQQQQQQARPWLRSADTNLCARADRTEELLQFWGGQGSDRRPQFDKPDALAQRGGEEGL